MHCECFTFTQFPMKAESLRSGAEWTEGECTKLLQSYAFRREGFMLLPLLLTRDTAHMPKPKFLRMCCDLTPGKYPHTCASVRCCSPHALHCSVLSRCKPSTDWVSERRLVPRLAEGSTELATWPMSTAPWMGERGRRRFGIVAAGVNMFLREMHLR